MVVKEHRWPAVDASIGEVVAYHVRVDLDVGGKRIWWEDTKGNKGLPEGVKVADLGLYRMDEVKGVDEIVLVEGEKCADALTIKGIPVVGTICGASSCPCDDALRPLIQANRVILWPDNDEAGRNHMKGIASRLQKLGTNNIRVVRWIEAPKGGDCVDAINADVDVLKLISESEEFSLNDPDTGLVDQLSRSSMRFYSAVELAGKSSEPPQFICEPWVVAGSITEISGKIKRAGKTTFVTHICSSVSKGEPFLGKSVIQRPVVYLTEQPKTSFKEALRRARLLEQHNVSVLFWAETLGISWSEVASQAVDKALGTAGLLIVDTLPQFAAIRGDGENVTGEALVAMQPLQLAASRGLGVVVVRHDRKSGGDVGDSARGSSAFGGAVDTVISIRRGEGNSDPNVRVIFAVSRFEGVPDELYVELTENGYISRGSSGAVAVEKARKILLDSMPTSEGNAMLLSDFYDSTDELKKTTANSVVQQLLAEDLIKRTGSGVRGSPYRYWRKNIHSSASKTHVTKERIFDTASDGVQLEMDSFGTSILSANE